MLSLVARRRIEPAPLPEQHFACPLCRDELGREVTIRAELDATTPFVSVADLSGCPHADVFGLLDRLTAPQEARLITAALDAYEAQRGSRPPGGLPRGS
jgi:hypothetical protein